MSEENIGIQAQEPKTSRLAVVAFLLSLSFVWLIILVWLTLAIERFVGIDFLSFIWGILFALAFASVPAAIIFGILALVMIKNSEVELSGKGYAIAGISIATFIIVAGVLMSFYTRNVRSNAYRILCGANLRGFGKAMQVYSDDSQGRYPSADSWCDLLIEHTGVSPRQFVCKASFAHLGESSYAINRNVASRKRSEIAPDVVVLFESNLGREEGEREELLSSRSFYKKLAEDPNWATNYWISRRVHKLRWNQAGGPEILTADNHRQKGCNVLFNNGRVKFIKPEDLDKLNWGRPQEKDDG